MTIPWWRWLPFQPWRPVAIVDSADEVPHYLPRNGAVLVGDPDRLKWVAFDCPCRTGHRIMLNLDPGRHPVWQIAKQGGRLTLAPSVDYSDGRRRCHYFVRRGEIHWAKDSHR